LSKRGKLREVEKREIADQKREAELAAHPGANVMVTVAEVTDDDGRVKVYITRSETVTMPAGWRPGIPKEL
jgi:hypothetical protein